MIVTLPDTTASAINKQLTDLRESGGAVALGRVLTLVIVTTVDESEEAIEAANDASREHPCRVLVVIRGSGEGTPRVDAEIRVGGDAGASEVILMRVAGAVAGHAESMVLPLLLPDAPVVTWWPGTAPESPGDDPLGTMAQRRITDAAAEQQPLAALDRRRKGYRPGDTDLAWTRLTQWRTLLAAALDQPPFDRVTGATVTGQQRSPSTELLAAWLAGVLKCPVSRERADGPGIVSVRLDRKSGPVELVRPDGRVARLSQPGQPERKVALARRPVNDCLSEELRRLDPDEIYEHALVRGLPRLAGGTAAGNGSGRSGAERSGSGRSGADEGSTVGAGSGPAGGEDPSGEDPGSADVQPR